MNGICIKQSTYKHFEMNFVRGTIPINRFLLHVVLNKMRGRGNVRVLTNNNLDHCCMSEGSVHSYKKKGLSESNGCFRLSQSPNPFFPPFCTLLLQFPTQCSSAYKTTTTHRFFLHPIFLSPCTCVVSRS